MQPGDGVQVRQVRGRAVPEVRREPGGRRLQQGRSARAPPAPASTGSRTKIRIAVAGWFNGYGEEIARKVRSLWDRGCDIRIVTTLLGRGVNRALRNPAGRGPVPIHSLYQDRDARRRARALPAHEVRRRSRASTAATPRPAWCGRARPTGAPAPPRPTRSGSRCSTPPMLVRALRRRRSTGCGRSSWTRVRTSRTPTTCAPRLRQYQQAPQGPGEGRTCAPAPILPDWLELD